MAIPNRSPLKIKEKMERGLVSRGRFAEGRGWKEGVVVDGREGLVKERRGRG